MKKFFGALCFFFTPLFELDAATFTVTSTNDSGAGTFRQAILDANTAVGADVIEFNLPAATRTISPTTVLPTITDPVTINGTTQPGFVDKPIVELAGTTPPSGSDGLKINTSNCVVRGLALNRWRNDGIEITGAGNVVEGCIIGLNAAGSGALGNSQNGIYLIGATNTRIGGTTAAQRNVISGNSGVGVLIDGAGGTGNLVEGNYVGTDWGGTLDFGNGTDGVRINGAPGNTIGGNAAGAGNLISGNNSDGIEITGAGSTNNIVQGNRIGTEVTGSTTLRNEAHGIQLIGGASFNVIGGIGGNAGNIIAFQGQDGVYVNGGTNNAVRGNSIFSNNGLGIDLEPNNTTGNDNGDGDSGANQLQNFPVLIAAVSNPANTVVRGRLNSVANQSFEIDFFSNTALDATGGEGRQYLGSTTVGTDSSGNASFEATVSGVATGKFITATATDSSGNTSEFSLGVNAASTVAGMTLTVTTTADSGAGSFRQAILDANGTFGLHTINFAIPGAGPHTILPATALPGISNSVVINGYSQPGAVENTDANAYNGVLQIILSGTNVALPSNTDGLVAQWPGVTIRGLNITGFKATTGDGIEITAAAGNCVVEGCLIGVGQDGSDQGNAAAGIYIVGSSENRIGGTTPGARNVISGNNTAGVLIDGAGAQRNLVQGNLIGSTLNGLAKVGNSVDGVRVNLGSSNLIGGAIAGAGNLISGNTGEGVEINGAAATNNLVLGNIIGPDVTGNAGLRNTSHGVLVNTGGFNTIGGVAPGAGNMIAFNDGDGVSISTAASVAVRGNSIRENNGQGIDLDNNGVTANDVGDGDLGANQRQNYPALSSAAGHSASTVVSGTLNSGTNIVYTIDFYSSAAADSSGNGEGEQYLGTTSVTTDGSGNASFDVTLGTGATGKFISATATDPAGNTSEFSANALASSTVPGPTFVVTTTADAGAGSLRQAILDANAAFSSNTIAFSIPGAGPHVITPATALPGISNTVTIDGYTQSGAVMNTDETGFNGILKITLNGGTPTSADGLSVQWPSVTIRGLNVVGWRSNTGDGIEFGPNSVNGVLEGCLIGIGLDDADQGNLASGVYVNNSRGHRIGGTGRSQRNVISGNGFAGVWIGGGGNAQNNVVLGNLIGTTRSGSGKVENGQDGVRIDNTANNTIGGTVAGARNLIAGNLQEGIEISGAGATNNVVQGNTIGGSATMTNNSHGVALTASARFNVIGGIAAGAANIISFNNGDGVYINGGTNNAARGNLIRDNVGLGIDLDPNGVTANDVGDVDAGSNQRQNFPVLTSAIANAANTVITGTLSSGTNVTHDIDFYSNTAADGTGNGEGQQYLGSTTVTTDASGTAAISVTLSTAAVGKFICATATDPFGNTSELGPCVTATSSVAGTTFTVTNTNDSGGGSLRQAILDANQLFTSGDRIHFNIPGAGPHTNSPVTALPPITDAVTIDGYSQPGAAVNGSASAFNGTLKIILNGTTAPANADGLSVQWPDVTIRGLNIVNFKGDGVDIGAAGMNCGIEGCVIGWGLDNTDQGNTFDGVNSASSFGRIGGATPSGRNVISGNNRHGVQYTGAAAASNSVFGNLIGTGLTGTEDGGNSQDGININNGARQNNIGGEARNVISGNGNDGVEINGAATSGNTVRGNYVGTDVTGNAALNNGSHGTLIANGSHDNLIGGVDSGFGNRLAFNSQDGVSVTGSTNNAIRGNSIVSNGGHGIDLSNNNTTANDVGDADTGPNQLQNYPALTSAMANAANTLVTGTLNSRASTRYELDFFSSLRPEDNGVSEGDKYLGSGEVTTDGSGNGGFNVTLSSVANGRYITATATDPDGNTSEFSAYVRADSTIPAPTLLVTTTNDTGAGSLRQALIEAGNYVSGEPVKVNFQIPGTGPHWIAPLTELPPPVEAVAIDGYTQPGATANTLAFGNNAVLKIVLVGTNHFGSGLRTTNSGNIIRGLSLVDFRNPAIALNGSSNRVEGCFIGLGPDGVAQGNYQGILIEPISGNAARANTIGGTTPAARNVLSANSSYGILMNAGASSNIVQGNYIGTSPSGMEARANNGNGVQLSSSSGNVIGGAVAGARNVISGNAGAGIGMNDSAAPGNRVLGNYLGTDVTGTNDLGNFQGVVIGNAAGNSVGGASAGEGNVIAFNQSNGVQINGFSIQTNNAVRGNSIFSNGGLGINLEFDGVLENDAGDADEGTNRRQNFPVITTANATLSNISIAGTLNTVSNRTYTIDFYANVAPDLSGNGEGEQYLGSAQATVGADGNGTFNVTLPMLIRGRFISATATDPDGNTSEFSDAFEAATTFPAETFVVTNTNDSGPGSLREAIRHSNASVAGVNNLINFNIPGSGPHVITLTQALDGITHSATINGFSQPGASANTLAIGNNAVLKIQLDGAFFQGLRVFAPHTIVRGLSVVRANAGVYVEANEVTIAGCFLGLAADGTAPLSNNTYGIHLQNGTNHLIGGAAPADRNIISGNTQFGIYGLPQASGARVMGNYIGTAPSGTEARPNGAYGIYLSGTNHVVGGAAAGAGNVIAANQTETLFTGVVNGKIQGNHIGVDATGTTNFANSFGTAVEISGGSTGNLIGGGGAGERNIISGKNGNGVVISGFQTASNQVSGNFIGTDKTGTLPLPNGIGVVVSSESNRVGGATEAEGNLIAFNSSAGLMVGGGAASTNNAIRRNRIFANANLGIDLIGDNVTPNDSGDGDAGPNQLQNFPVITSATIGVTDVTIGGHLLGAANQPFEIDFFASVAADPSGFGEGQQYLGSRTVTTDGAGRADFTATFLKVAVGRHISATATDSNENTSEFSAALRATSTRPAPTLLVTNTNDSGAGSLRQALIDADQYFSVGANKIHFNIPGAGPRVISVLSQLPATIEPVEIDGFTQPGSSVNTQADSDNAVRLIQVDGGAMNSFVEDGFRFLTGGNAVRGLTVSRFPNSGIYFQNSSNNVVEGNVVISNRASGIILNRAKSTLIGGSQLRARNLALGNPTGISVIGGAEDNSILGNFIGVDATGTNGLTQTHGVRVIDATNIVIGTTAANEGNFISFNTRGVTVSAGMGVAIRGNKINGNSQLGIDLGLNGVSANDQGDADTGPNGFQNFPVLQSANLTTAGTRMIGALNSIANSIYTLDFYWSPACDSSGNGEGLRHLGSTNVTTDGLGNAVFDRVIPAQAPRGVVTVTATDAFGNTSEFSACTAVGTEIPPQTYVVTNTNDSGPGSLRQAILDANAAFTTGRNLINFNIPGTGIRVISPTSPLPFLTAAQTINGYTQPGAVENSSTNTINAVLLVQVDGAQAGTNGVNGITIAANDCIVRGLIITRFSGAGVSVESANNVVVTENLIGTVTAPFAALEAEEDEPQVASKKGKRQLAAGRRSWVDPGTGNGYGLKVTASAGFSTGPSALNRFGNVLKHNLNEAVIFDRTQNARLEQAVIMRNGWNATVRPGGFKSLGTVGTVVNYSYLSQNNGNEIEFKRSGSTIGGSAVIKDSFLNKGGFDLAAAILFDQVSFSEISGNSICGMSGPGINLWGGSSGSFQRIYGNRITENDGPGLSIWQNFNLDIGGTTESTRNVFQGNRGGAIKNDGFGNRWYNNDFGVLDALGIVNVDSDSFPNATDIRGVDTNPGMPGGMFDFVASFTTMNTSISGTGYFYEYLPSVDLLRYIGNAPGQLADGVFSSRIQISESPGRRTIGAMFGSNFGDFSGMRFGSLNGLNLETSVTKTGPAQIPLNTSGEFNIKVEFTPDPDLPFAAGLVNDLLPSGLTYEDFELANPEDPDDCEGGMVSQVGQNLGAGFFYIPGTETVIEYKVRARGTTLGAFNNVATIATTSANDPSSGNNSSSAAGEVIPQVAGVDLGFKSFRFSNEIYPWSYSIGTAEIQNYGTETATGVIVILDSTADVEVYQAQTPLEKTGERQWTTTVRDIAPNSSALINWRTTARTPGQKPVTGRVVAGQPDGNSGNDGAGGGITVNPPPDQPPLDFGDAPDRYRTLLVNNGPRHLITQAGPYFGLNSLGLFDGDAPDADLNGFDSFFANGDDLTGENDEGMIKFLAPLTAGEDVSIEVYASKPAYLDFWIDLNGDGAFDPSNESFLPSNGFLSLSLSHGLDMGLNVLTFRIPESARLPFWTFARFRISDGGNLSPWGYAANGEVQDHRVLVALPGGLPDFGDAPDSPIEPRYPTLSYNDGAVHIREPGFHLGQSIDVEPDGQPDANARGDDMNQSDDEDGALFLTPLARGQSASVKVTVSVAGATAAKLDAWIDFNADFDWSDAGEKIFNSISVSPGENTLNFNVPAGAAAGTTYARFRLSHEGNLAPGGLSLNGEVEDYVVTIEGTAAPFLNHSFSGGTLTLSWLGNFSVQSAPTVLGPWTTQSWTSPHPHQPTGAAATFFRLTSP